MSEQEMKKPYIAILTGRGEGCDYTIGCNRTTIQVQGESLKNAEENFVRYIAENYSGFSGLKETYGLFDIILVEATQVREIDMQAYMEMEQREKRQSELQEAEKREQAEYNRLKAKYESAQ